MEEEVSSKQVGIKFGVIFGLVSTIYTLIFAILRIQSPVLSIFLTWGIVITVFVLACKDYKNNSGGMMSFGKGYGILMITAAIGGLIRAVGSYVYYTIDPTYLDFVKEQQQNSPFGPPPQDAPQNMTGMMEFFTSPEFLTIMTFLAAIFAGLIFGAIVSAIMKNGEDEY
jgi:hypothetical protein